MNETRFSPIYLLRGLFRHRHLIRALVRREIQTRYRGSVFGSLWSYVYPLLMLAVYTFVFGVVFKAKWDGASEGDYALALFGGLLVFNLVSETLASSTTVVLDNPNYVKKVVFPLEILPVVCVLVATFHFCIGFVFWVLFAWVAHGTIGGGVLLAPILILPVVFLSFGLSWVLSGVAVFFRDTKTVIGVATSVLMFMTPIFYPLRAVPDTFRSWVSYNPLSVLVEGFRGVLLFGANVTIAQIVVFPVVSIAFAWLGFSCFQRMRRGFADVL